MRVWESSHPKPLGRNLTTDKTHAEKYSLASVLDELTKPVPVVMGIEWYTSFDRPMLINGKYYVDLGGFVRGGHEVCFRPPSMTDLPTWWERYDQGTEGACVGFACSRMMSLLNRSFYDGFWLYHEAQKIDGFPMPHEGTNDRAAFTILRDRGHKLPAWQEPRPLQGVSAFRWASSLDELYAVMHAEVYRPLKALPILNSWGRWGYPHVVWFPDDVLEEVIFASDYGDAGVVTDR